MTLNVDPRVPLDPVLTAQEADSPQATVQRRLDVNALVQRRNDALLQVQPVVGADGHSQQPQATDGKDTAQQRQGLPAARAHGPSSRRVELSKSQRHNLEEEEERNTGLLVVDGTEALCTLQVLHSSIHKHSCTDGRSDNIHTPIHNSRVSVSLNDTSVFTAGTGIEQEPSDCWTNVLSSSMRYFYTQHQRVHRVNCHLSYTKHHKQAKS